MALPAERMVRDSTGFPIKQLAAAFDRLMDPRDWQAPICAVISAEERELVEMAVLWFTGVVAQFESLPGSPDRLLVKASGFRIASRTVADTGVRVLAELPRMSFLKDAGAVPFSAPLGSDGHVDHQVQGLQHPRVALLAPRFLALDR